MYLIYLDGELFYDPRSPNMGLSDLTLEMEVNKSGALKFTIPKTHPQLGDLKKMYSELSVYQDDDWLYTGRVLSDGYFLPPRQHPALSRVSRHQRE